MPSAPAQTNPTWPRERLILALGLAVIILLAWLSLFDMAGGLAPAGMEESMAAGMDGSMAMGNSASRGLAELSSLFLMWSVMMVAMMLPSAIPMILVFQAVNQRHRESGRAVVPAWLFVLGYIAVWIGFSLLASLLQWGLSNAAWLSASMMLGNPLYGGAMLVLAGLYQWSPLKHKCLNLCRSPLSFLMSRWRAGRWGALRMGLEHGAYCVGCCWLLMALLFVTGVMNLFWVMVIAAFVLIEKILPWGTTMGRVAGVLLICLGVALATSARALT